MRRLISNFGRNQRGNVAVVFGLAAIPILGVAGVALDYSRASHFRSKLQTTVDAAALAGATETSDDAINGTVDAFMNAALPGGLTVNHVTYTLDIQPSTVAVTAEAKVQTTIGALFFSEMPVSASATASHGEPIRLVDISVTNFNSDAADANSIYWYIVPKDGSLPADVDLHLLLSNDPKKPAPAIPDVIKIGVDDRIAFALINVTGGVHPYGKNSYGDHVKSVHKFYSQQPLEKLAKRWLRRLRERNRPALLGRQRRQVGRQRLQRRGLRLRLHDRTGRSNDYRPHSVTPGSTYRRGSRRPAALPCRARPSDAEA
jgi:Flp pilus assembly protein TadG